MVEYSMLLKQKGGFWYYSFLIIEILVIYQDIPDLVSISNKTLGIYGNFQNDLRSMAIYCVLM